MNFTGPIRSEIEKQQLRKERSAVIHQPVEFKCDKCQGVVFTRRAIDVRAQPKTTQRLVFQAYRNHLIGGCNAPRKD